MPHVPRLANPTPAQTHAALMLIHQAQRRVVGPNPTAARIRAFQDELANDPRLRQFRETIQHYTTAAAQHLGVAEGRRIESGNERLTDPLTAAAKRLPIAEALENARQGTTPLGASFAGVANQGIGELRKSFIADLPQIEKERREQGGIHLPIANINLTDLATKLATLHVAPGGNIVSKLVNEAFDIPGQTFLSGADVGSGLRSAYEGNAAPLAGVVKGLKQQINPLKLPENFENAPLSTALTFAGGENLLGRLVGKVGRSGIAGDRIASAFSTARPDLQLTPTESLQLRRYNTDPLRKAAQVAYERHVLPNLPGDLAQPKPFRSAVKGAPGAPHQATGWRLKRHLVGGAFHPGVTDYVANAGEALRKGWVKPTAEALSATHPGSVVEHLVPLIYENLVGTEASALTDLHELRDYWKAAQEGLKGEKLAANQANIEHLDAMLANPAEVKAALPQAFEAAQQIQAIHAPSTAVRVAAGELEPGQLHAANFPYAQFRMGAEHAPGLHPVDVAEYQQTKAALDSAEAAARQAAADVHAAQSARDRAVGEARRAPRNRPPSRQTPAERRAADGGHTIVDAAEAKLTGAKDRLKVAEHHAKRAKEELAAKPTPYAALRAPDGHVLTNDEIRAHMKANGIERAPGYLSHKVGVRGNSSFYESVRGGLNTEKYPRMGVSFANGTADHSWEALVGTVARSASKAAKIEAKVGAVRRLGIGGKGGALFRDPAAVRDAIANLTHTASGDAIKKLGEFVAVRAGDGKILKAAEVQPHTELQQILDQHGLTQHTPAAVSDAGGHFIMHKKVAERLLAHDNALTTKGDIGKFLELYQQGFRHAKLNTSVPHIAGVLQEQLIRLAAEGVAPASKIPEHVPGTRGRVPSPGAGRIVGGYAGRAGTRVDEALKAKAAQENVLGGDARRLEAQMANRGGQAGAMKWQDVQRIKGNQFQSELGRHIVGGLEGAGGTAGGRVVKSAWREYSRAVEGGLGHAEHATRNALTAKALKDSGLIPSYRAVIKMTDKALGEWLDGTMTPQRADAVVREVDNMGGNWNRQTPGVREAIGKYVPFAGWWLNSMRWLRRMPVTHPIKTAMVAAIYQATKEQRNKEGQGVDAASPVPNFLQGGIDATLPLVGRVKVQPSYYSPGGTLGPEAGQTAVDQLFPAFRSLAAAAESKSGLTGNKLLNSSGRELTPIEVLANILGEGATGPVPFATQAQKVLTRGGKPYGTSNLITDVLAKLGGPAQIKPGTERPWEQVIGKMLAPTRFDFPAAGSSSGGGLGPVEPGSSGLTPRERMSLRRSERSSSSGLTPRERLALKRHH